MRILFVEGNPDDTELVREAIHEIAETRRWRQWVRNIDLVHLERLEDALLVLAEEQFDAVLAGAILPDAQGLEILFSLRAQVPEIPVILLVSDGDDAFAISAVREGADECLPIAELDCALLARALRNTLERRRRVNHTMQGATLADPETGVLTRESFMTAAGRDSELARRLNRSVFVAIAIIESPPVGADAGTEAIETAAALRLSFAETDLIARLDKCRFAVLSICGDTDDVPESVSTLARYVSAGNRQRNGCPPLVVRLGTVTASPSGAWSVETLLSRAETALCENGPSAAAARCPARRASA